jgi:L-amino acid N-acyltransferase YncA
MIRPAQESDASQICAIYNRYVLSSSATFETEPVTEAEMKTRIVSTTENYPWCVFEEKNSIAGYAYATAWRARAAYFNSVESTVYLHSDRVGKGIGSLLYLRLFEELKKRNTHVVIGGIALPNDTSVSLHEKLGFRKVAHFKEVGFKFGKWVDVGYWQKLL